MNASASLAGALAGVHRRRQRSRVRTPARRYAAIDLGTHNCRMLIAEAGPAGSLKIIDAFSRVVRLGEGLAASGRLADAPVTRALDALAVCAARLRALRVESVMAVATEACRRAANGDEFVARAEDETGVRLTVIPPTMEASLTARGCAGLLDPARSQALLFDIGGGSTELAWIGYTPGMAPKIKALASLPAGVVDLAERFGTLGSAAASAMAASVEAPLLAFAATPGLSEAIADGRVQMVGTSGTVTTLAAVHLGLAMYDRRRVDGTAIDFAAIAELSARLCALSVDVRARIPCIGQERADLVVAGCAILSVICRLFPAGRLTVADRGIREGMLLMLIAGDDLGRPLACGLGSTVTSGG